MCFFFKQKTAYEMRISDWSSDVCSSDLQKRARQSPKGTAGWGRAEEIRTQRLIARGVDPRDADRFGVADVDRHQPEVHAPRRRRVVAEHRVPIAAPLIAERRAVAAVRRAHAALRIGRSEEHTSELQSLMRISY